MKIRLETLTQGDFENLYAFEVKNRAYFEKTVPSRGDDLRITKFHKKK